MKSVKAILLMLIIILTLVGCNKDSNDGLEPPVDDVVSEYVLDNNKTPTYIKDKISSAILKIYMGSSQDDIDYGILSLAEIATKEEIEALQSEAGKFDPDKRAIVRNLTVSVANTMSTDTRKLKYIALFDLYLGNKEQSLMIEFACNNEGLINSHNIWIKT